MKVLLLSFCTLTGLLEYPQASVPHCENSSSKVRLYRHCINISWSRKLCIIKVAYEIIWSDRWELVFQTECILSMCFTELSIHPALEIKNNNKWFWQYSVIIKSRGQQTFWKRTESKSFSRCRPHCLTSAKSSMNEHSHGQSLTNLAGSVSICHWLWLAQPWSWFLAFGIMAGDGFWCQSWRCGNGPWFSQWDPSRYHLGTS